MKVLLFALSLLVAAHAQYDVDFIEDLNTEIDEFQFRLLYLDFNAKKIADEEKALYESQITDFKQKSIDIINEDESVAKLRVALKDSVAKGEDGQECLPLFEKSVSDLAASFEQTVIDDFKFGVEVLDLAKEAVLLESQSISQIFKENVESEKVRCMKYPIKCKITSGYVGHVKQLRKIIVGLKGIAAREIQEVLETLKLKASDEILEKVVLPVKECAKK